MKEPVSGPPGPKPAATVLSAEEAAVAFRQHTLLPLDDCLDALQETRPSNWADSSPLTLSPAPLFSAPRRELPALGGGGALGAEEKIGFGE